MTSSDSKILTAEELDRDAPNEALRSAIADLQSTKTSSVDWKNVDRQLFARIEPKAKKRNPVVWVLAGGFIAAAAAVALSFLHTETPNVHAPVAQKTVNVGTLASRGDHGEIKINGVSTADGFNITQGDRIEASGSAGVFELRDRVRWSLENGSRVVVERTNVAELSPNQTNSAPLILSLERGAAEAQVVPVPNGEAFAIDVTSARGNVIRVAVHGTHLRVARVFDHVTVDLTEGVVLIGAPPKRGSTLGELVTAPAHVEFDVDAVESIRVEHAENSVRSAASLSSTATALNEHDQVPVEAPPLADKAKPSLNKRVVTDSSKSTELQPDPHADEIVRSAVRACVLQNEHSSSDIAKNVSTTLTLTIKEDGYVGLGQFNPPLFVSTQECINGVIFDPKRVRFASSGSISIPIEVTR